MAELILQQAALFTELKQIYRITLRALVAKIQLYE
jgi:hypothetical protein